jgi:anti-sigma regulatory factor (Ser/Thr protein kinase)/anti-anti-sigma regulatory factor
MSKVRAGGEAVRKFLIENVDRHPSDIVRLTTEEFGCTRQAVHKHLQRLVTEGAVTDSGTTRNKRYVLASLVRWEEVYTVDGGLAEDVVWRQDIANQLGKLPENVLGIWQYGFTEIFNNVIDHSEATDVSVRLSKTLAATEVDIYDNGVGVFKKIREALDLADERHAVLELAKGKFTTDPANHSGEGIFFSSRMFDKFSILSGEVYFSHEFDEKEDLILPSNDVPLNGTLVKMVLQNYTSRTAKEVFDTFASDEDYAFTKTIVPVKLMKYGDDNLVSRSQAKRLLARFDRFKAVVLDFSGVTMIGQAFADEVFRVYRAKHPGVELTSIHASPEVQRMINRAEALGASGTSNV